MVPAEGFESKQAQAQVLIVLGAINNEVQGATFLAGRMSRERSPPVQSPQPRSRNPYFRTIAARWGGSMQ